MRFSARNGGSGSVDGGGESAAAAAAAMTAAARDLWLILTSSESRIMPVEVAASCKCNVAETAIKRLAGRPFLWLTAGWASACLNTQPANYARR